MRTTACITALLSLAACSGSAASSTSGGTCASTLQSCGPASACCAGLTCDASGICVAPVGNGDGTTNSGSAASSTLASTSSGASTSTTTSATSTNATSGTSSTGTPTGTSSGSLSTTSTTSASSGATSTASSTSGCAGTGWQASPTEFSLPVGYGTGAFTEGIDWSETLCESNRNIPEYSLVDVTGDGLPDLVVTATCNDSTVGDSHWLVYPGSSSGWATSPTEFSLPLGYGTGTFTGGVDWSETLCESNRNIPEYYLVDVTGDGLPDIVVVATCNDSTVGDAHWLVYPGSRSGWAASPTSFSLPVGYGTGAFTEGIDWSETLCESNRNIPEYYLVDVTGDGLPDIVVVATCSDSTVGDAHWLVYPGSRSGWAASPTSYSLPVGYGTGAFTEGIDWSETLCESNRNIPEYSLVDVTGDGLPDIVVVATCNDSSVGDSHWLVYPGSSSGWAASPTELSLPVGYGTGAFTEGIDWSETLCESNRNIPEYSLVDVTGDGLPDLVVTATCNDSTVGDAHWLVYQDTCH